MAQPRKIPSCHTTLLTALDELLNPPETPYLRGTRAEIATWARELHKLYAPRRMVLAIPADAPDLPLRSRKKRAQSNVVAYICPGSTCSAPIDSLGACESVAGRRR